MPRAKLQVAIDKATDNDSTYQRLNDVGNARRLVMRHGGITAMHRNVAGCDGRDADGKRTSS